MDFSTSDLHWMVRAYTAAVSSPDTSSQVGVAIRCADGLAGPVACNRFPYGTEPTPDNLARPRKYALIEHAERNACYVAARNGYILGGATMYGTYVACADCARAIIQSGICTVVRHAPLRELFAPRWGDSLGFADEMLHAAGVEIVDVTVPIPDAPLIRIDGQLWDPSTLEYVP